MLEVRGKSFCCSFTSKKIKIKKKQRTKSISIQCRFSFFLSLCSLKAQDFQIYVDTSYILIFSPFKHTHKKIASCISYSSEILRITWKESTRDVSQVGGKQETAPCQQRLLSAAPLPAGIALSPASRPSAPRPSRPGRSVRPRGRSRLQCDRLFEVFFGNDLREESAADAQLRLLCRSATDFHRFRTQLEPLFDWKSAHLEEGGTIRPFPVYWPLQAHTQAEVVPE